MKPEYTDRPEAIIVWAMYFAFMAIAIAAAWVSWTDDTFMGGAFFSLSALSAVWMTYKAWHALGRDRRSAWEERS